jgi:hypothetical protein
LPGGGLLRPFLGFSANSLQTRTRRKQLQEPRSQSQRGSRVRRGLNARRFCFRLSTNKHVVAFRVEQVSNCHWSSSLGLPWRCWHPPVWRHRQHERTGFGEVDGAEPEPTDRANHSQREPSSPGANDRRSQTQTQQEQA